MIARTAFLAADQHVDRRVMQRIQHGKEALARHAGQALHALHLKLVDQNASAAAGIALSSHDIHSVDRFAPSNPFYLLQRACGSASDGWTVR